MNRINAMLYLKIFQWTKDNIAIIIKSGDIFFTLLYLFVVKVDAYSIS